MICPSNNHDVYRLVVSQIRNHPTCWFIIGRIVCTSILGWFTKGPTWWMTRMVYSVLYQVLKSYHIIYHFISLIFQMCPNHWSVKAGAFSSSPPSTASPETPPVPVLNSQLLRLLGSLKMWLIWHQFLPGFLEDFFKIWRIEVKISPLVN
jgi:hypothetical protein